MKREGIYGLLAEFDSPGALLHACEQAYAEGYRRMDAYSPYPIEEVSEAIGMRHNRVALIVLLGGLLGLIGGYSLEYWVSAIAYPLNIGGKPFHAWPAFIPPAFECTVLGASVAGLVGMLAMNGLPMPYHPVFNAPNFALASKSKFFLCLESTDPMFDIASTRAFLQGTDPNSVTEVPY